MAGGIVAGNLLRSGIRRTILVVLFESDRPLSDTSTFSVTSGAQSSSAMGTFDEEGNYQPRQVVDHDLGMSFADAIAGTMVEVEDGQLVNGTVVKIDKDEVLLDIGYKSEGVILSRELSIRNDVDPHEIVKLGEQIEALVLQKEDKEGRLLLSKKRAQYERAWGTIEKIKEAEGMVEGPVIEVVKGGLIVDIGLRGFLPASLVELRRVRDLAPYIGKTVQAKIIELDKNRNNVVLSRRAFLEETQKESRDSFLTNLKPGEIREGVVSSVVSFGAFVDLGGMDGLIHVSELSWKHVDHPGAVVAVGDPVTVQVLDVDFDRERISLSLKATQQDPWQEFASTHEVGQLVYGRVTKLVPFGGFVQVGDGIEGLVHISEMSTHHVEAPEQVVTPGEELWVKIIDLDLARRRISLSIKQAAEGGELAEEYRQHFEIDEHGNWAAGGDDSEREAAWAEYYENNPDATPGEAEAASAAADAAAAAAAQAPVEEPAPAADTADA
jgi:small subunit ribosomal protein S1